MSRWHQSFSPAHTHSQQLKIKCATELDPFVCFVVGNELLLLILSSCRIMAIRRPLASRGRSLGRSLSWIPWHAPWNGGLRTPSWLCTLVEKVQRFSFSIEIWLSGISSTLNFRRAYGKLMLCPPSKWNTGVHMLKNTFFEGHCFGHLPEICIS